MQVFRTIFIIIVILTDFRSIQFRKKYVMQILLRAVQNTNKAAKTLNLDFSFFFFKKEQKFWEFEVGQ